MTIERALVTARFADMQRLTKQRAQLEERAMCIEAEIREVDAQLAAFDAWLREVDEIEDRAEQRGESA